ncbi:MAG: hypothetical protein J1F16_07535, partial [Muribaculaceae bacterium]|nr:hypothetical protein [Muribaculaceae bacterium]
MTPLLRKIKRRLGIYYYGVKKRRKTNQSFKIDLQRLLRFFLAFQKIDNNKDSLRCKIMLLNHQLEKAQTYKKAKEGYGKEKIRELIASLIYYNKQFGRDDIFSVSI